MIRLVVLTTVCAVVCAQWGPPGQGNGLYKPGWNGLARTPPMVYVWIHMCLETGCYRLFAIHMCLWSHACTLKYRAGAHGMRTAIGSHKK